jgi:hypothetical protein
MTPFPKEEKNWPDVTVSFVIALVTGTSAMDRFGVVPFLDSVMLM